MKKLLVFICLFLFMISPVLAVEPKNDNELLANATNGLLMEISSGEILYEKGRDERVAVASMTKMVAQIIILEQIEKGNLTWDEKVTVSKNAADMGGSQCGFCTPGMILASYAVLKKNPHPSEEEIRMALSGNLCRCTGYQAIVNAVLKASEKGVNL